MGRFSLPDERPDGLDSPLAVKGIRIPVVVLEPGPS
jgi:hypothetical protein